MLRMLKTATFVLALSPTLLPSARALATPTLQGNQMTVFDGDAPRMTTRIAYFSQTGSPGQFSIDYGQPEWKAEYEKMFAMTKGKRIRFGKDFWTTLDTNVGLTIGGKEVAAGYYYLALDHSSDDKWSLILLDAKAIQAEKSDAFLTDRTKGGSLIPLTYESGNTMVEKLTVKLQKADLDQKKAKLVITWGNHKLTAPIVVNIQAS